MDDVHPKTLHVRSTKLSTRTQQLNVATTL